MGNDSQKDSRLVYEAISRNIRSLLDSKGMQGKELAAEIGVTPATISRYIQLKRVPELILVYRIAEYFGVTMDWLLGNSKISSDHLTDEQAKIADLYLRASDDDQAVIKTVLRKYENSKNN